MARRAPLGNGCHLAKKTLLSVCTLGRGYVTASLPTNQFSSVQLLSRVHLFLIPWTAARKASLPITNSRSPSSQRCHPAISSSVVPFSSCPQSLPASESFPMSQKSVIQLYKGLGLAFMWLCCDKDSMMGSYTVPLKFQSRDLRFFHTERFFLLPDFLKKYLFIHLFSCVRSQLQHAGFFLCVVWCPLLRWIVVCVFSSCGVWA